MKTISFHKTALAVLLLVTLLTGCGGDSASGLPLEGHGTKKLSNGLQLHTMQTSDRYGELITITCSLAPAARNEKPEEAGFSSLATRFLAMPVGEKEADSLRFFVENQPEQLLLSVQCLREDVEAALTALTGRLGRAVSEDVFVELQESLVSSLERVSEDPARQVNELVRELLYDDSPFAYSTSQRLEALKAADLQSFQAFLNRTLQPSLASVAVSGDFDTPLLNKVVTNLAQWRPEGSAGDPLEIIIRQEQGTFNIFDTDSEIAVIYMLKNLPDPAPQDYYPLRAVSFILNGARVGTRFGQVEQLLGDPNAVESVITLRNAASSHLIIARSPVERTSQVAGAIRNTLEHLMRGTINDQRILDQELLDSRNFLRNSLIRNVQSPRGLNQFILWAAGMGFEEVTPEAHLEMIAGLNNKKLERVIDTYFAGELLVNSLLLVGPEAELSSQFEGWEQGEPPAEN